MKLFEIFLICVSVYFAAAENDKILPDDALIQEWLADQRDHVGAKAERVFVNITHGELEGTTYVALGGDTIYAWVVLLTAIKLWISGLK